MASVEMDEGLKRRLVMDVLCPSGGPSLCASISLVDLEIDLTSVRKQCICYRR